MPGQSMLTKQLFDAYYSELSIADHAVLLSIEGRLDLIAKRFPLKAIADGETFCHHVGEDRLEAKIIITEGISSDDYDRLVREIREIFDDANFRLIAKKLHNDFLSMSFLLKRENH
ncbi:hypothetical protein [Bdellovibrio sp. NC01]|uniref:hypothetical protein n=1 Tax=Bdellovibrio sp. NC01 TaxID=2220073 RepID=UPI001157C18C|nr:hypothetical protein [Bdellovibrio sp. NC01]QDK36406.1 hypothetical protein DOE51_01715 [Bdellovibrio sp. NC01]